MVGHELEILLLLPMLMLTIHSKYLITTKMKSKILLISLLCISIANISYAQVFRSNQIIGNPIGTGVIVSTSTGLGSILSASSSPTVGYLTATSTTATSTFANGINLVDKGCFAVDSVCIPSNATSTNYWYAKGNNIYNANSGNVGIGTSSPAYQLDVYGVGSNIGIGNASRKKTFSTSLSTPNDILTIASLGNSGGWRGTTNLDLSYNAGTQFTAMSLVANTNGTTANVGIGTTSPYSMLSISNSATTAANTPLFTIASTTGGTATSTLFTVLPDGSVSIGSAVPQKFISNRQTFSIYGATNGGEVNLGDGNGNYGSLFNNGSVVGFGSRASTIPLAIYSGNAEKLRIDTSGNVGIGTTTPSNKLEVAGNSYLGGNLTATGTVTLSALTSRACLGTDANGLVGDGTCTGGGGSSNSKWATSTDGVSIYPNSATQVGILTSQPNGVLDVAGGNVSTSTTAQGDADLTELAGYLNTPYVSFGEYQNFLTQTESFGTLPWVSSAGTITNDKAINPNGTLTAETIPVGADNTKGVIQTISNASLGNFNFSVWLKASSTPATVSLSINDGNGTATTTGTPASFTLQNGWKRYSVTQNIQDAHTLVTVNIINGTSAVNVWGAQLEQSTSSRVYSGSITTTAIPVLTRTLGFRGAAGFNSSVTAASLVLSGSIMGVTNIFPSASMTMTISNTATSTFSIANGIYTKPGTAATNSFNSQQAPRILLEGNAWDTTASASRPASWNISNVPFWNGSTTTSATSTLSFNYAYNGLATTTTLVLDSSNHIGIGTTTPLSKLQISDIDPKLYLSDTGGALDNKHWFIESNGGKLSFGTTTDAQAVSPTRAVTIANNGNVGIGADGTNQTIDHMLEVYGTSLGGISGKVGIEFTNTRSASPTLAFMGAYNGSIQFGGASAGHPVYLESGNSINFALPANGDVYMGGTGADDPTVAKIVIKNSGTVGIGTSTPKSALTVGNGDIFIGTTTGMVSGIILEASDATCHRIVVSTLNVISASTVNCPF
jgi:hypothetical protein